MFFIHGGGNVIGSADQGGLYDGQRFASEHEVVLVSINYRLGPLGWFSHPALRETESRAFAEEDNSGNYGTFPDRGNPLSFGAEWMICLPIS